MRVMNSIIKKMAPTKEMSRVRCLARRQKRTRAAAAELASLYDIYAPSTGTRSQGSCATECSHEGVAAESSLMSQVLVPV